MLICQSGENKKGILFKSRITPVYISTILNVVSLANLNDSYWNKFLVESCSKYTVDGADKKALLVLKKCEVCTPPKTLSFLNLPEESCIHILDFISDEKNVICLNYSTFYNRYKYHQISKKMCSDILWMLIDSNLSRIIRFREDPRSEMQIQILKQIYICINNGREDHNKKRLESIGTLLFLRYKRSIVPFSFLHSLIFGSFVESIDFAILTGDERNCSFGENCRRGAVAIVISSTTTEGDTYMAEFILCNHHLIDLRYNSRLF